METCTYAVGDIHGRADLLESMLALIEADSSRSMPRVIFLGDIVDRGPDSYRAMELVSATLERWPSSRLVLGNHDWWFYQFMSGESTDPERFSRWLLSCGGAATMLSYGHSGSVHLPDASKLFLTKHPRHLEMLAHAKRIVVDDEVAYVHAGIDPDRPLGDQQPHALMMIRQGFLDREGPFPRLIVHGHTPVKRVQVFRHRVAIDTGAYASGLLSCLRLGVDGPDGILLSQDRWGERLTEIRNIEEFRIRGQSARS